MKRSPGTRLCSGAGEWAVPLLVVPSMGRLATKVTKRRFLGQALLNQTSPPPHVGGYSFQTSSQRGRQIGVLEVEPSRQQLCRDYSSARQESRVRHFAQRQAQGKRWSRQQRGARQRSAQNLRKLAVGDRLRRNHVNRPGELIGNKRVTDRGDGITDLDPTPKLIPLSKRTAQPQFEGQQHFGQRAALPA
jgi:hypothetical protein